MSDFPITFTDAAKKRLSELASKNAEAKGIELRIATGKGCGGNEYRMDYMTADTEEGYDKVELEEGGALYIPIADSFHLFGIEIDFVTDDLGSSQFTFMNPNEAGRCGCGLSFSLERDIKNEDVNPEDVECYREF